MGKPWAPWSNGIDLSDRQWNEFRRFIPLLFGGAAAFGLVSQGVRRFFAKRFPLERYECSVDTKRDATNPPLSDLAYQGQIYFYCLINFGAAYFLHGNDAIYLTLIALANFAIGRLGGASRATIPLTWIFNCAVLYQLEMTDGFRGYLEQYAGLSSLVKTNHGLIPLSTYWKMTMLRNIAFNCDFVWMKRQRKLQIDVNSGRFNALMVAQEEHRPSQDYSLSGYFAYTYYLPLFIAGPILSFNAFSAQVRQSQSTISARMLGKMIVQLVLMLFMFELSLHYVYYHAFNEFDLWKHRLNPMDVALTGFLTLNFMYTKFTIIWRIFRVWALLDGIDTPENMLRCVNNNHTFAGFWRSWHGSFNKVGCVFFFF
jgi:membrane-bound O-acyltransferase GUP1_2